MTEELARVIWLAVGAYAGIGGLVALPLAAFGLSRIDPGAARAPLRVKLLILPGLVLLWPMMLARFAGGRP